MTFITIGQLKNVKIPKRLSIAMMLFCGTFIGYMMRVNLSIIIIAMVKSKNATEILPDHGPRYEWDQHDQSNLLGAFAYGYLITSLPGGILAEKYGGKIIAGYSFLIGAILTAISPFVIEWNFWVFWTVRLFIGLAGGVCYPCCHNLISKWSPPDEKGKFVAVLMGGTFGTVVTWPVCGLITEHLGWKWAFYLNAIFAGFITLLWFLIVSDSPSQAKDIREEEKKYIEDSLGNSLSKARKWPPFLSVCTSIPFLALVVLHFGSMWGLQFIILSAPKFLSEVLKFNLSSAGFLSSLPNLARIFFSFVFGTIVDVIRRKNLMNVTLIRKTFCIGSHILPGILLIILAFFGRDPMICVAIMTLSLGCNGAATVTNLQNSQDLAPNYAATLYGTINLIGASPGFFSPMVVAHFTKESNTIEEWKNVFLVGGAVYISGAIVFILFGSGNIQKWNSIENTSEKEKTDKDIESSKL